MDTPKKGLDPLLNTTSVLKLGPYKNTKFGSLPQEYQPWIYSFMHVKVNMDKIINLLINYGHKVTVSLH